MLWTHVWAQHVEDFGMVELVGRAQDVYGAQAAGLMAAFVARGQVFPSAMHPPDVKGNTLVEAARALVA